MEKKEDGGWKKEKRRTGEVEEDINVMEKEVENELHRKGGFHVKTGEEKRLCVKGVIEGVLSQNASRDGVAATARWTVVDEGSAAAGWCAGVHSCCCWRGCGRRALWRRCAGRRGRVELVQQQQQQCRAGGGSQGVGAARRVRAVLCGRRVHLSWL